KHVVEKLGDMKTTIVGTGPFKLKGYTRGTGTELVKNPDYWVKGRPYLDGITFVLIQDSATRLAAVRTHQVNMTGKIFEAFSPADVETIKKDAPTVTFVPVRSTPGPWLFMNSRKAPFNDLRVRRAVSLAIDRDAAIKVVAQGSGKLGEYFNILEGWGLTDQELRQIPGYSANKDAERVQAKKLMADAGYANGFDLSILSRTNTLNQTASTFVAGQLQTIGVRAKIEVLEDGVFFSRGGNSDFQTMLFTPAILVADPIWQGRYFIPGGTLDFTGNEVDEKLKDLWLKQAQETNDAKRHDLIKEVSRQSFDQAYALPLVWPNVFTAYWPEVHGVVLAVTDYAANRFDNVWLSQ
ncbi:MAG: ABC transporter substrate-binding protein, partial [Chloroflexota bacterium]